MSRRNVEPWMSKAEALGWIAAIRVGLLPTVEFHEWFGRDLREARWALKQPRARMRRHAYDMRESSFSPLLPREWRRLRAVVAAILYAVKDELLEDLPRLHGTRCLAEEAEPIRASIVADALAAGVDPDELRELLTESLFHAFYVLVIGPDEAERGTVSVRDLQERTTTETTAEGAVRILARELLPWIPVSAPFSVAYR